MYKPSQQAFFPHISRGYTAQQNSQPVKQYSPQAHEVLDDILEKYIEFGTAQFQSPEILKVAPISKRGSVIEIAAFFGGARKLRTAVQEMQTLLYAS